MSVHPWPRPRPQPAPAPAPAPSMLTARVEGVDPDGCVLDARSPVEHARVAAGCLLQPEAGDSVLLLLPESGPCFVVCVLERSASRGCLRMPGGAELHGAADALSLRAPRLELRAGEALDLHGPRLGVRAGACRMSSSTLEIRAGRVQALMGSLQARGRECLTRLGRSLAEFGDSVRRVRGIDETHATDQRVRVERRLHMQCRDASIVAHNHVRVDGRRIDLG